ncbi:MAG: ATP-binding cassette domain-containing protein [Planctomycetes bacterium]|nr:ATP-binding cassette domain-containing protein [Planctomycetota bacterium]MBU1517537.1 ATP-binding cassette domain-containing protein [Planctomycetota bacterium]MBU2597279.1 ATP-binding cassette domain-containing protein [Planctomycetota bacterium]
MAKTIEIKNFSYKYPDGTVALSDIDLSIEEGQKVVLIGPNGAGKSTLMLAMAGFATGRGEIIVKGLKIEKKNLKKIRTVIGCCFENPDDQLFMPTLFDDVAFGPLNMGFDTEQVKMRVAQALRTVGMEAMAEKAPHHLSAGQKRAAAIATVLSMSPEIIALDEPDGSLDPRNREKLVGLLKNLSQTLIIATCNMNFAAAIGDRAVLVDKGRIIADGDAKEIMFDTKLMTEYGLERPAMVA